MARPIRAILREGSKADESFSVKRDGHSWHELNARIPKHLDNPGAYRRAARAEVLWRKIKLGAIVPPASDLIARDYAAEFKRFAARDARLGT